MIADNTDFGALYVTGDGVVTSHLGLSEAGVASDHGLLDRVAVIVVIAGRTTTPVIADADAGYGGLLNVREIVHGYERGCTDRLEHGTSTGERIRTRSRSSGAL